MKILFECDGGAYVAEVHPNRLYAKVDLEKDVPIAYSHTFSLLLNPASFHEYRGDDAMLQNKIDKMISTDLKSAMK